MADENFHGDVVRALRRRVAGIDLVRIQDIGLSGIDDSALLSWCSDHDRILLTHDRTTVPLFATEMLSKGIHLAGIFVVDDRASWGLVIDQLAIAIQCSEQSEWRDLIIYFPWMV